MHDIIYIHTYVLSLFYGGSWLQMALSQKFRDVLLGTAVRISNLHIDRPYRVLHAERVEKKNGLSIIPTIRESK
jgi:hypothetical protein